MFNVVWRWPVLKNSSRLHFVHRMCLVTSFFYDEILMFTRNPSTGERSWKNFQPIQCLWNVSYYIGALHTNFLTYFKISDYRGMGWWTEQCPPVHGLEWTILTELHQPLDVFLFCFRQSQQTPRNLGDYFKHSKSFPRNVAWSMSCYILQYRSRGKARNR